MDEVVQEFLVESYENLDALERDLVGLESEDDPAEVVKSIFRNLHTIKGTAGMLGYTRVEHLAHAAENLLGKMRDEGLPSSSDIVTALLESADALRAMVQQVEDTGEEPQTDHSALVARLEALQSPDAADQSAEPEQADPEAAPEQEPELQPLGELLSSLGVDRQAIFSALQAQEAGDPRRLGEILIRRGETKPQVIEQALQKQQQERQAKGLADNSIRVNVELLDTLMNLVGELVLVRNQILRQTAHFDDATLSASAHRLNLVTTELQEGVMKTRMQPIGTVWGKFPRIIRDLAQKLGKKVRIEMEGKGTELDKTILEAVKDPLTHLVRNCVDHGLETPEEREFDGKPEEGTLTLRAFHEGGYVNIEIADDGQGIAIEKVRSRAIQRGIVSAARGTRLTDKEVIDLVFAPGFSTADHVTNVSGRGVGMDVVKTNIERIGGTIDVASVAGKGSTFRIRIPLTLAIIPALIIKTGDDERLAIPQVSLVELVRLEGEQCNAIERIGQAAVYRLRGNLLPIVFLERVLYGPDAVCSDDDVINIVVLQGDEGTFGLVVREVQDTEEIVVKPLGREFKGLNVFAGATIMGDGRVALILDVNGVATRAGVHSATTKGGDMVGPNHFDTQSLLVVSVGDNRHVAIDLSEVERLEDLEDRVVETAGSMSIVQYRGGLMPLIDVGKALFSRPTLGSSESYTTVVHRQGHATIGLVVQHLVDIVEEHVKVDPYGRRPGVQGSCVVQGRVLELLDVSELVARSGIVVPASASASQEMH